MTQAQHTPGPWKPYHRDNHYTGNKDLFEIHYSNDGECVAEVVYGEANARLIAAAPDLLVACEHLLWSSKVGGVESSEGRELARTAIAKARGEA